MLVCFVVVETRGEQKNRKTDLTEKTKKITEKTEPVKKTG
jgi:hypothetical protein